MGPYLATRSIRSDNEPYEPGTEDVESSSILSHPAWEAAPGSDAVFPSRFPSFHAYPCALSQNPTTLGLSPAYYACEVYTGVGRRNHHVGEATAPTPSQSLRPHLHPKLPPAQYHVTAIATRSTSATTASFVCPHLRALVRRVGSIS